MKVCKIKTERSVYERDGLFQLLSLDVLQPRPFFATGPLTSRVFAREIGVT